MIDQPTDPNRSLIMYKMRFPMNLSNNNTISSTLVDLIDRSGLSFIATITYNDLNNEQYEPAFTKLVTFRKSHTTNIRSAHKLIKSKDNCIR